MPEVGVGWTVIVVEVAYEGVWEWDGGRWGGRMVAEPGTPNGSGLTLDGASE